MKYRQEKPRGAVTGEKAILQRALIQEMSPVSSDIRKFFNEQWYKNIVSSAVKVKRSVLLWTKVHQRAQIQENSSANTDPRKLPAIKVMFKDQWDKQSFSLYGIRSESSWANTKFCGLDSTAKDESWKFCGLESTTKRRVLLIKTLFTDQW